MSGHAALRPTVADRLLPVVLAVCVFLLDQITKRWIRQTLGPLPGREQITLLGDWLTLVYYRNTGVAFGLFQNLSPLFIVTSLLICTGLIYFYMTRLPAANRWVQLSIGLVLGGALGNVADRIMLNYVVDFISIGWWPVFNVADSAVTIGIVILASYLLLDDAAIEAEPDPAPVNDALLTALLSEETGQHSSARPPVQRSDSGRFLASDGSPVEATPALSDRGRQQRDPAGPQQMPD